MKSFLIFLSLIILVACNDDEPNMKNKKPTVELALNIPIQDTLNKNTDQFTRECMQNLGLCWYKIKNSANDKNLPGAVIGVANSSLSLQQVTTVTIVIDESLGHDVDNIDITLRGLPDNSTHENNRDFILEVIKNIKISGWERYYLPEEPRISGSQAPKITTPGEVLGRYVLSHPWLDPDYNIDIEHWLKADIYNWFFYNDGTYLELNARRRDSKESPMKTGTYLITLNFKSERAFWLSGISSEKDRANWVALLPGRLEISHAARVALEEKARAAGIEIDESYQDPPIKALEPRGN